MTEYDKILEISSDDRVELASSFKDLIHKKLCLGQTRYTCRYGTLSEGHGKITPAQRYYQAIKEMWSISKNIKHQKVMAKRAQADLLDAQTATEQAKTGGDRLRAEAAIDEASMKLIDALVNVEDAMRMLDEYNKVREELEAEVDAKYPLGIEQAEQDNWIATYEWEKLRGNEKESWRIPLPPEVKGQLGLEYKCIESLAPLIVTHKLEFESIPNEDVDKPRKFLELITQPKQIEQIEA